MPDVDKKRGWLLKQPPSPYINLIMLVKPLHIAEVLTMGQLSILGIHTNTSTEGTSNIGFNIYLEDIVIALVANYLERMNAINLATIRSKLVVERNKLQTNSIHKTLLVDDISQLVAYSGLAAIIKESCLLRHNVDTIPTLGNGFLPLSQVLSQTIVVGSQLV